MDKFDINVLYVEDDVLTQTFFSNIITPIVANFYMASNALEGLEIFNKHDIDLVITDIIMPEYDGFYLVQEIRKTSKCKVIFVAANNDSETLMRAIDLQVEGFIAKPISFKKVFELLEKFSTVIQNEKQIEVYKNNLLNLVEDRTSELTALNEEYRALNEEYISQNEELNEFNRKLEESKEKILKSEHKYRSLFENMNEAFAFHKIILDNNHHPIDYKFIDVNPAFEKMLKKKRIDVIDKTVCEIFPGIENDPANWIQKYGNVALTGNPIAFEDFSIPLQKWYSIKAYSPKKNFFAATFTDITNRKLSEQNLKESEARFKALSEYSHNAICLVDEHAKIVWANQSLAKMGQLTVEELCNSESFAQFIAPESIEFVVSNFTKFVMGEEYEHHYSFYFIRTDGEMRLCEKYMTHYTDKNGSRFLVISMLDVTEQRKNEAEKYAQLEELQRWQKVTLGREDRNMELKKEVNELLKRLNEPIRYKSQNEN